MDALLIAPSRASSRAVISSKSLSPPAKTGGIEGVHARLTFFVAGCNPLSAAAALRLFPGTRAGFAGTVACFCLIRSSVRSKYNSVINLRRCNQWANQQRGGCDEKLHQRSKQAAYCSRWANLRRPIHRLVCIYVRIHVGSLTTQGPSPWQRALTNVSRRQIRLQFLGGLVRLIVGGELGIV